MNEILRPPLPVLVIAAFLAILSLLFVGLYLVPGLSFRRRISRLLVRLKALQRAKGNDPTSALSALFAGDRTLNHLWHEYRDTLHAQKETNSAGIQEVVATRATV